MAKVMAGAEFARDSSILFGDLEDSMLRDHVLARAVTYSQIVSAYKAQVIKRDEQCGEAINSRSALYKFKVALS